MQDKIKKLCHLPNIGLTLAKCLIEADIESVEQLRELGTDKVFIRISTLYSDACLSKLYAIEGAIQGIRWHLLSPERKQELKAFYHLVKTSKF